MTELKQITVLGTGVLGSQIAYQTAYHGFDVVAYDINARSSKRPRLGSTRWPRLQGRERRGRQGRQG